MRAADVARVFDGERLTLARHLAGLKKNALAGRIGKTPTAVAAWESGSKRPAAETVGQLALALGVELEFFQASGTRAQTAACPHFRSLRSTTQAARDQARAFGIVAVDVTETLERHVEFPELNIERYIDEFSNTDSGDLSPEQCAQHLRLKWHLGAGPAPHMVRLLENHGIVVVFSPPQVARVDAYSFESADRPVVVLNPVKRDYYRQRYDVAHELGHLVMHNDSDPGSRKTESEANRFAAEFLMPSAAMHGILPPKAVWPRLLALKEEWKVSIQALLFRAKTLGIMKENAYKTSMVYISNQGWRRQEPGRTTAVEQPSLLPQAATLLQESGREELDLASECKVPLSLFRVLVSRSPQQDKLPPPDPSGGMSGVVSLVG